VQRLALTPRFDERAARAAFSAEHNASQDAAWHALSGYSFVQSTDVPGWWALHARMREALAENHVTAPADDRFWIAYWRSRSESETDDFASLAWYHQFRLEPARAREDWNARAERLRRSRRMREHYVLLGWWEPIGLLQVTVPTSAEGVSLNNLGVEYAEASLGHRGANLQQAIACYQAALRVYTESDFPQAWAMTQNNLGTAYSDLPSGDRGANLEQAIACYQAALRVYTESDFRQAWAMTQNNLGIAYKERGLLEENHSDLEQALASFEAAERGYRRVGMIAASEKCQRQAAEVRKLLK
jgi:tetratricopeptide (TPR) repeat protein